MSPLTGGTVGCAFGVHLGGQRVPKNEEASPFSVQKVQDFSSMRPPERLGVGKVCNFDGIVLAHQMYHYLKHSRYSEVVRCRTNVDIDKLREAAFRFGIASMR